MAQLIVVILILWIAIYLVDSAIQLSNNWGHRSRWLDIGQVKSHQRMQKLPNSQSEHITGLSLPTLGAIHMTLMINRFLEL